MSFFDSDTTSIFNEAGLIRSEAPELFEEARAILAHKMANISVTMGLSYRRLHAYDEQKQALIKDLKKLKADDALR